MIQEFKDLAKKNNWTESTVNNTGNRVEMHDGNGTHRTIKFDENGKVVSDMITRPSTNGVEQFVFDRQGKIQVYSNDYEINGRKIRVIVDENEHTVLVNEEVNEGISLISTTPARFKELFGMEVPHSELLPEFVTYAKAETVGADGKLWPSDVIESVCDNYGSRWQVGKKAPTIFVGFSEPNVQTTITDGLHGRSFDVECKNVDGQYVVDKITETI